METLRDPFSGFHSGNGDGFLLNGAFLRFKRRAAVVSGGYLIGFSATYGDFKGVGTAPGVAGGFWYSVTAFFEPLALSC
jgi:hypothetical protein